MAAKKETTRGAPRADDALARDIRRMIETAERACDGHQLSDDELDALCEAALSANGVQLEKKPRR